MAIDNKYGRVSFSEPNTIGEDEPVVVFRAADPLLPKVLAYYRLFCWKVCSPKLHLAAIDHSQERIEDWQRANREQVRVRPSSSNWDGVDRL